MSGAPISVSTVLAWLACGAAALLHLWFSLVLGARLAVGHLAAERLVDEFGLREPLDPGSRGWSALTLAQGLSYCAAVLLAAFAQAVARPLLVAAAVGVGLAVLGRAGDALVVPRRPERILASSSLLLRVVDLLLGPLAAPFAHAHAALLERSRQAKAGQDDEVRDEQLEDYIRGAEAGGLLEEAESELLREIVDAGEATVREVMTPRGEIVAVSVDDALEDAVEVFTRSRHSRLLVHDGGLDRVVGVLPVRDLLPHLRPAAQPAAARVLVRDLVRPAPHVPATKRVLELLRELQQERQQIAVVVDEYGNTAGMVSLEDLVEEIVGEIRDEHEADEEPIRTEETGALLADGLAPVADLARRVGREIAAEGVESVGGLVFARLGRAPRLGDKVEAAPGLTLEVVRLRGRRVAAVRVLGAGASGRGNG